MIDSLTLDQVRVRRIVLDKEEWDVTAKPGGSALESKSPS